MLNWPDIFCRICYASLERRLWTSTQLCGCPTARQAHACTAKRSVIFFVFFSLMKLTFQVQFTLVNRRHHCRKCGVVCCNACSSKRWKWKSAGLTFSSPGSFFLHNLRNLWGCAWPALMSFLLNRLTTHSTKVCMHSHESSEKGEMNHWM